MRGWRRYVAGLVPVAVLLAGATSVRAAETGPPTVDGLAGRTVTLPTGDRVTITRDRQITFAPGSGRAGQRYATSVVDDHLFVIPTDRMQGVAAGKLDRNSFDVTRLAGLTTSPPPSRPIARNGETYTLTIRYLDAAGRPTARYMSRVHGVDDGSFEDVYDADGTVEATLPKGRYAVDSWVRSDPDTKPKDHLLVAPAVDLRRDTTIVMDARLSKPLDITVGHGRVEPVVAHVGYARTDGAELIAGNLGGESTEGLYIGHIGAALRGDQLVSYALTHWAVPGADRAFRNSPARYGLMDTARGTVMTGLRRTVRDSELATLPTTYHAQAAHRPAAAGFASTFPEQLWGIGSLLAYDPPSAATVYLEPGIDWSSTLLEIDPAQNLVTEQQSSSRTFAPGRTYRDSWNAAVFGPESGIERDGEYLGGFLSFYSDQAQHLGWSRTDAASTKLYRNDELLVETDEAGDLPRDLTAPPAKSRYRLEVVADRPSWSDFSTHLEASWTFESAATSERTPLPLWAIRFQPAVDARNQVRSSPVTELPFTVKPQEGSAVGALTLPTVDISGDDGKTWHHARVTRTHAGHYVAIVPTPADSAYISIRAKVSDSVGNTAQQTNIRGYALAL